MTDDLVGRLRKGRLIQSSQTRMMTCAITGLPIEVGTGEICELPHPDALEAAARIEALEAALVEVRKYVGYAFDGTLYAPQTLDAIDGVAKAALTPEAPHAD